LAESPLFIDTTSTMTNPHWRSSACGSEADPTLRSRLFRIAGMLALLCGCGLAGPAITMARAQTPSWGAVASQSRWYGVSFNSPTREAAERMARAQCDRAAGRAGVCEVRTTFDRACGALATGNYGEWGTASAATALAAGKAAVAQCDSHLPTEPCKILVSVCSPR
jgi:hypothetical protein